MTTVALLFVLSSAVLHSSWNFLLKRSEHKAAFLCGLGLIAMAVFVVPATILGFLDNVGLTGIAFGAGSAFLHGVYGRSLVRGYQLGDLSTVYPIARGFGPALIPIAAVLLFDERISPAAAAGIALVVFGIAIVQLEALTLQDASRLLHSFGRPAARMALLTGALITTYSLWDKAALDYLPPITLNQFAMTGHVLFLAPLALQNGAAPLRSEWRTGRLSVLAAGFFAPAAYILILVALTTSQVSYIASTREIGIVIGTILGVVVLGEGYGIPRVAGATLIVAGVITVGVAP